MNLSKIFYFISATVVFLLLFVYFFHPVTNLVGDLGYYLKIGEIIVATKSVPTTNLFSYTAGSFPFINANWLSEVLFYMIKTAFGFNGLIILSTLLAITSFSLIFIAASKKAGIFTAALIGLIYAQVIYERTDIKPELFSFLLLSIFLVVLYKYREQYTKWIFALIPLQLLWANLHIYFFLGIVILVLFIIDALISKKENLSSKKMTTLILVTLASIVATIINPNLVKGALYPLFVLNNYAFPVEENINFLNAVASYNDTTFLYFGISVALLWIGIIVSIKRLKPIDILLAAFFTFMGIFAVRAFPIFVLGTFITCTFAASNILSFVYEKLSKEKELWLKIGFFITIFILLIPTIRLNIEIHGFGFGVIDYAKDAINFIKVNNIKGPIYNNFDFGNYLDYALYPKEKVFVDNRAEAYPKDFFSNTYFPMQDSPETFTRGSEKYNLNTVIIAHTDTSPDTTAFLAQIVKNDDWKIVYLNNSVVIFLKNTQQNRMIIQSHLINEANIKLTRDDLDNKTKVRQLVNFFRSIGWEKSWLKMNLRYLELEPNNCAALQNISYIYQKEGNPNARIYINKFIETCGIN